MSRWYIVVITLVGAAFIGSVTPAFVQWMGW